MIRSACIALFTLWLSSGCTNNTPAQPTDLAAPDGPAVDSNQLPPVTINDIDAESYPGLGPKELGQLRWVLKLAQQPLDDFTHFEAQDQKGMTAYRYALAFSVYFLAMEQYHKLPAWSEALKPAMDTFNRKMILKPVWDYWAETSKGLMWLEPNMNTPYPAERDPVRNKNVMYSGHLAQMINLYAALYRDMKWDKPGSIELRWADDERYLYDNYKLTRVIYDQFLTLQAGASCEPNTIFPQCNQHPVLAYLLYDKMHGTQFSVASEVFFRFFKDKKLIDPVTHETAALYLIKQNSTLSQDNPYYHNLTDLVVSSGVKLGMVTLNSATANGWTGTFMHAWQPAFVAEHYPHWKQGHVVQLPDGTAELKSETIEPWIRYGFMAMIAAEMGDEQTRDALLAYADKHFKPVWQEGTYHYPHDFDLGVTNLTDKLLALARATPKDGMLNLHQQLFDDEHFAAPRLRDVPYPKLLLRRALWDRDKRALVVSTAASPSDEAVSFTVVQLDPELSYRLYLDGALVRELKGRMETVVQLQSGAAHTAVLLQGQP